MKLLAFAGRSGSGKDTASGLLSDGYVNIKFAGPIKAMLYAYLDYIDIDSVTAERMIEGDLKKVPSVYFGDKTPQYAQQTLGDWFRGDIDPDILLECFSIKAAGHEKVVCSDVRKQNEIDHIATMGGKTALVQRELNEYGTHITETEVDTLEVDFVIDNTSTLEYLELQVREFEGN